MTDTPQWAVQSDGTRPTTDAAPDGLDWKLIAKAAGEHGIRYRTNTALAQFLAEIGFVPAARITALEAALAERDATIAGLREANERACRFLNDLSRADLDELAADGGVTVGMVLQQQAKWEATKLSRAALRTVDGEAG